MSMMNKPTKGFVLKASCLLITTALLSACANSGTTQAPQATSARLLFSDNADTASNQAKSSLVSAIGNYLNSERYVLSTYHYKAMPINHAGSIDEGSDPLWMTALKTYEYKTTQDNADYKSDAYRTSESYADENGDLPYLRYDDEKAGVTPETVVSREVGMSAEYQLVNEKIKDNYADLRTCLGDLSSELDDVIKDKPTATSNDKAVKTIINQMNDCVTEHNQSFDEMAAHAQGYQKQDIGQIRQCALNFKTDIGHMLSPTRQYKSLTGESYHLYDTVWLNYWSCNQAYHYSADVEPYNYIGNGTTKPALTAYANLRQCSSKHHALIDTLKAQNKTYRNNAKAYAQAAYDTSYCYATGVFDGLGKTPDTPISKPTTPDEVSLLYAQYSSAFYDDYDSEDEPKSRFGAWFDAYKQMKTAGKTSDMPSDDAKALPDLPIPNNGMGGLYTNMMSSLLDYMKRTPEQLDAKNAYQYNNTVMTAISHHQPNQRKLNTLLAFDYHSATADQSIQLPMSMDFNHQQITADVSAALPLIALATPKHAPLPAEIPNGWVKFNLPSELQGVLPLPVIYDALNRSFLLSFSELDGERFTPMAMTHDTYAKQIGASQVIKLNLSSKDIGKMLGIASKQLANDLKAYIDAHPELYQAKADTDNVVDADDTAQTADEPLDSTDSDKSSDNQNNKLDATKLKHAVDNWVLINQGYHTSDVGSLYSLFEAILPINMDVSLYYYLDGRGQLIGAQSLQTMDDQIQNLRLQTVGQTRYSAKMIDHAYAKQFAQNFAQASDAVDGNAWLAKIREENTLKSLAQDARDQYEFSATADAQADAAMGESEAETQCSFDDQGQVICH